MKHLLFNLFFILIFSPAAHATSLFAKYSSADFIFAKDYCGEKISVPFFEFRGYHFSDYSLFGISYSTEKIFKNFPCCLKVGNLTNSGLYSKLKSPVINSSISPFGTVAQEAVTQNATMPSAISTNKGDCLFLQAGYSNKKSILKDLRFNWFNSPDESLSVFSGKIKLATGERSNISLSSCAGYFDYSENDSASWFLSEQYYKSGVHFCNISQLSFNSPSFDSTFYLGFFETPFANYAKFYRFEVKYSPSHFVYSLAGSYIPHLILTADDSKQREQVQLKGGLQYRFLCGEKMPLLCRTGINSYCKINLLETEHPLKTTIGLQLTSPLTSFSATVALSANVNSTSFVNGVPSSQITLQSGSIQLKNSWFINDFSPGCAAGISISPNEDFSSFKTTESYGINILWKGNPKVSFNNKLSVERKNWILEKTKFTSSIDLKLTIKKVSVTVKLSIENENQE